MRIICASVDGSAIIAAYGGNTHGDVRFRANPRSGSTVAKILSGTVDPALLQENGPVHTLALEPLIGLSKAELCALAASVLAPAHARRLKQLLRLNREKKLTPVLQEELDALLAESDRIALVKAKANYTLSLLKA